MISDSLTVLTCGANGLGRSNMFSIEKLKQDGGSDVLSRTLINCGDGTQRFCMDNRIKLIKLSCILLTSLSPIHVSGLAGILLGLSDLGVGNVTLVGPSGLQGYLQSMQAFCNRKYPVLRVIEVNKEMNIEDIDVYVNVHVRPIFVKTSSDKDEKGEEQEPTTIALCAILYRKRNNGQQKQVQQGTKETQGTSQVHVSIVSFASRFAIEPSVEEQTAWMSRIYHHRGVVSHNTTLLFGISVHCSSLVANNDRDKVSSILHNLSDLYSEDNDTNGSVANVVINTSNTTDSNVIELMKPQETLAYAALLCPWLFGSPLPPLKQALQNKDEDDMDNNGHNVSDPVMRAIIRHQSDVTNIVVESQTLLCVNGFSLAFHQNMEAKVYSHRCGQLLSALLARKCKRGVNGTKALLDAGKPPPPPPAPPGVDNNGNYDRAQLLRQRLEGNESSHDKSGKPPPPFVPPPPPTTATIEISAAMLRNRADEADMWAYSRLQTLGTLAGLQPRREGLYVTFLGTGCAKPSKYRNGSSILLQIAPNNNNKSEEKNRSDYDSSDEDSDDDSDDDDEGGVDKDTLDIHDSYTSILLDCGEGTVSQLYQSVGGYKPFYHAILRQVRVIWISHQHADHICGFPALLQAIYIAREQSSRKTNCGIVVIAPMAVLEYYEYCANICGLEDLIESWVPLHQDNRAYKRDINGAAAPSTKNNYNRKMYSDDEINEIVRSISGGSVLSLISIPVFHCYQSFGISLKVRNQYSNAPSQTNCCIDGSINNNNNSIHVVYSGDCRPSASLIQASRYCDLLIHEATFDDSLCQEAFDKRHCTVSEALQVSQRMHAKYTILTHLSQRYPVGMVATSNNNSTAASAFDFMRVGYPTELASLPETTTHLSTLLASYAMF